jgi:hypothetical protein
MNPSSFGCGSSMSVCRIRRGCCVEEVMPAMDAFVREVLAVVFEMRRFGACPGFDPAAAMSGMGSVGVLRVNGRGSYPAGKGGSSNGLVARCNDVVLGLLLLLLYEPMYADGGGGADRRSTER